jgi:hypothetical protein
VQRKLNYTGRKRIAPADVDIELAPLGPGRHSFTAKLDLARYRLPRRAHIFIEAYRHAARMRFEFGSVGFFIHPPGHALELTEFAGSDNMLFRVKVVDFESELGKLLAEVGSLRPGLPTESGAERESLLHVRRADLGERLWRLELAAEDSEAMPCIVVHSRLDKACFTNSAEFRALVLPAVVERVLTRLPLPGDCEPDSWADRWWTFLHRLGAGTPAADDDREEWIDDAVNLFCLRNNLMKAYVSSHGDSSGAE